MGRKDLRETVEEATVKSPSVNETVIVEGFNHPDYPVEVQKGDLIQLSVNGQLVYSYPVDRHNLYHVQLIPVIAEESDKVRTLFKEFDEEEALLAIRQIVLTRTKKPSKRPP